MRQWLIRLLGAAALAVVTGSSCTCNGAGSRRAPEGLSAFYGLEVLPSFHLTLDDEAMGRLASEPRKWVHASFAYQGETYPDIGVRLKGHRSMRRIDDKPSFKVRFDKYVDGVRFLGQRELTLNNLVEDPTMVREALGYRLLRELGVPAPEVGYAQVYVNDKLYGLYAIVETVDERFLARHFDDASGALYEGEYGCDLYDEDVDGFESESKADPDRAELRALARAAAGPAEQLFDPERGLLASDQVLAYLAASMFIGDFDGYRHSHNYRIYQHPGQRKWFFIPWGFDRVFKKRLSVYDSEGYVAKRCFADPACRRRYARVMRTVAERVAALGLEAGVHVISTFIDEAARADTRKPYSSADTKKAQGELLVFLRERPAEVLAQLACLDDQGNELDRDGDGYGCMDCNDADPAVHPGAADVCDSVDNDCSALVDDNPSCGCERVQVEGVTFHLCDLPMPWAEAAAFCEAQGLSLARIDSEAEARGLYDILSKRKEERWWIGLADRDQEGVFRWRDGAVAEWVNWAKGEPDNDGCNQDCAAFKDNGKARWHDTHCAQHRPFVCR